MSDDIWKAACSDECRTTAKPETKPLTVDQLWCIAHDSVLPWQDKKYCESDFLKIAIAIHAALPSQPKPLTVEQIMEAGPVSRENAENIIAALPSESDVGGVGIGATRMMLEDRKRSAEALIEKDARIKELDCKIEADREHKRALEARIKELEADNKILVDQYVDARDGFKNLQEVATKLGELNERIIAAAKESSDSQESSIKANQNALKKVLSWIDNWSPDFVDDFEWQFDRKNIDKLLNN